MGYIFLFIALICGATKGFCGKKTSGVISEYKDALFTNVIRMFLCIIIGLVLLAMQGNINLLNVDTPVILITFMSGVTTSAFVVLWLLAVKKGAYMMLDVFTTIGVIIPLTLSSIFFGEVMRPNQWLGLAVLLIAVIIMCSYNNLIKEKMSLSSLALLIFCGISCGLTDFSQKLYTKAVGGNIAVYSYYTYVFSAAVLVILYLIERIKNPIRGTEGVLIKRIGIYVIIMAICLFANSYFKTLAATLLTSAKLYPLNLGASLIMSSFMSSIFFREKLTPRCIVGIILTFIGLLIMNLL